MKLKRQICVLKLFLECYAYFYQVHVSSGPSPTDCGGVWLREFAHAQ